MVVYYFLCRGLTQEKACHKKELRKFYLSKKNILDCNFLDVFLSNICKTKQRMLWDWITKTTRRGRRTMNAVFFKGYVSNGNCNFNEWRGFGGCYIGYDINLLGKIRNLSFHGIPFFYNMGIPEGKFSYIDTFCDYVKHFRYGTPEYFVYIQHSPQVFPGDCGFCHLTQLLVANFSCDCVKRKR